MTACADSPGIPAALSSAARSVGKPSRLGPPDAKMGPIESDGACGPLPLTAFLVERPS
jgi:hypothetical protein